MLATTAIKIAKLRIGRSGLGRLPRDRLLRAMSSLGESLAGHSQCKVGQPFFDLAWSIDLGKGRGCKAARLRFIACMREIDRLAGSRCALPDGRMMNPIPMPAPGESGRVITPGPIGHARQPLPHLVSWAIDIFSREAKTSLAYNRITEVTARARELYWAALSCGHTMFSPATVDFWYALAESRFHGRAARSCAITAIEAICGIAETGSYSPRPGKRSPNETWVTFRDAPVRKAMLHALEMAAGGCGRLMAEKLGACARRLIKFAQDHGYHELCDGLVSEFFYSKGRDAGNDWKLLCLIRIADREFSLGLSDPFDRCMPLTRREIPPLAGVPAGEPTVEGLVAVAREWLARQGLSRSTIGQYDRAWQALIAHAGRSHGGKPGAGLCHGFAAAADGLLARGEIRKWQWKLFRRSALLLAEAVDQGPGAWHRFMSRGHGIGGFMEGLCERFISSMSHRQLSEARKSFYRYVVRRFCKDGGIGGPGDLGALGRDRVALISKRAAGRLCRASLATYIPALREWVSWLHAEGLVGEDFSWMLPTGRYIRTQVPSYLSEGDEIILRQSLGAMSFRDQAIILLALDLGLRSVDIACMRMDCVDWDRELVTVVQHKTGVILAHPLLPEVGNAIYSYVMLERPRDNGGTPALFLRAQAPHTPLTRIGHVVSRAIRGAGVRPLGGGAMGSHTLRYTLVHRLLGSCRVPHHEITQILGHRSASSDTPYYSVEEENLRKCALDLSEVGGFSWEDGANG